MLNCASANLKQGLCTQLPFCNWIIVPRDTRAQCGGYRSSLDQTHSAGGRQACLKAIKAHTVVCDHYTLGIKSLSAFGGESNENWTADLFTGGSTSADDSFLHLPLSCLLLAQSDAASRSYPVKHRRSHSPTRQPIAYPTSKTDPASLLTNRCEEVTRFPASWRLGTTPDYGHDVGQAGLSIWWLTVKEAWVRHDKDEALCDSELDFCCFSRVSAKAARAAATTTLPPRCATTWPSAGSTAQHRSVGTC